MSSLPVSEETQGQQIQEEMEQEAAGMYSFFIMSTMCLDIDLTMIWYNDNHTRKGFLWVTIFPSRMQLANHTGYSNPSVA